MKKKLYLVILLISVIATGVLLYGRIDVERQTKSVEILADYEEFAIMANQQGMTESELFTVLKDAGVTGVVLKEETLYSMVDEQKPLEYSLYKNLIKDLDWKENYGPKALEYLNSDQTGDFDIVVRTYDSSIYDFLKSGIEARYDSEFYHFFDEGSVKTIVLKGTIKDIYFTEDMRYKDYLSRGIKLPREAVSSVIEDIGMGYDPVKVNNVLNTGLDVNLRPSNYDKYNDKLVDAYFNEVEKYDAMPNVIIFNGREVMSYTAEKGNYSQELYDKLKALNLPIGMVEAADQLGFSEQRGIDTLAKDLDYNVVRVFPMIEYIQQRYNYLGYYEGAKEIENTLYRAITERNIRVIYFRPYKDSKFTYYTDLDEYKKTFDGLATRLEAHHITIGKPSVMPYHNASIYLVILSAFGLLILGLILLKLVFDIAEKFEWILFAVGLLGIVAINFVAPNLSIELFAFTAANVFPILAILFLIEFVKDMMLSNKVFTLKGIIAKYATALSVAVTMCLLGGLYVASYISRADYLLEISYFRGVKASLLLPIFAFVIIYIIKLGYKRQVRELDENTYFIDDIKRFLTEDVKLYYALIAVALAGVFYVYLARSGHDTNIEVLDIELIFRNFLEDVVLARPRTKEIFLAFPALSAGIYFAARGYNKLLFPCLFGAVIGLTSVVNTFCHSRAPVYLSTVRELTSLAFSLVIGIVVIVILDLLNKVYVSHFGSKKYE
ncbi:DUF5693 family protein [Fusibacter bizertensis]|uniref:DUF5693 family protein n=1 Tax=Fusibacter bizertensis TaxID=1488331 RepID=A0ABT6NBD1_9FIRM|nr:DUF5693 family protein [Fusibacter bizertensis]MDH8677695.1 DUF5693 family protein [Fusibacter bizertensis]